MQKFNRRDFVKVLAGGISFITLPFIQISCAKKRNNPNIIYILADDLGYGDVGCLNPSSKILTPNIDQLAQQGIVFSDAHSGAAVCTPTRYGILTGRYCWRSRLKENVLWPWDEPLIEPDRLTVGEYLRRHGYTTACIGKWHLGWEWSTYDGSHMNEQIEIGKWDNQIRFQFGKKIDFTCPIQNGPTARGFDYYFGDDVPNFPPYCFIENDKTVGIPSENKPDDMFGAPGPMLPGWNLAKVMPELTRKAVEFITAGSDTKPNNKKDNHPFFLYFALTAPHTPIAPDENFKGKSQAGAYGDYVQQVDWTVGQIVQALEKSGQTENTLVIFTSDNGSPGRDGTNMSGAVNSVRRFGHNPSYIYRGIKADIWEGGHRVPFMARWPEQIKPNTKSDQIICLTDLFATCAAILGDSLPENTGEDSYNILPALLGKEAHIPIREAIVHHSSRGVFSIRQGPWKMIEGRGSGGWSKGGEDDPAPGQLYNIIDDPEEKNNLYQKRPDIVKKLQALLDKYREK